MAPIQTASEFLRNIQDSPTKKIDHKLKKSVARLVRKERAQIILVTLDSVTIDNSVGSLARLAEAIWFGENDAVKQHQRGHQCMDLFKSYIIGKQIMDNDRTVFLTFSNVWVLLNFWRAVGTGYDVQLFVNVTGKASTAALNRLGFGVNRLGSHFAPLSFSLIPAECESSTAYAEAYHALKQSVLLVARINTCSNTYCRTCRCIEEVRDMPNCVAAITSKPYTYTDTKHLPVAVLL